MFIKTSEATISKVYSDDELHAKKNNSLMRELSEEVEDEKKEKVKNKEGK